MDYGMLSSDLRNCPPSWEGAPWDETAHQDECRRMEFAMNWCQKFDLTPDVREKIAGLIRGGAGAVLVLDCAFSDMPSFTGTVPESPGAVVFSLANMWNGKPAPDAVYHVRGGQIIADPFNAGDAVLGLYRAAS